MRSGGQRVLAAMLGSAFPSLLPAANSTTEPAAIAATTTETPLESEARLRAALAARGDTVPDVASDHLEVELAEVLINFLNRPDDTAETETRLGPVLARAQTADPVDPAFVGRVQHLLAQTAMMQGDATRAETYFDEAIASLTVAHGPDARQTLTVRQSRAVFYSRTGRPAEADTESTDIVARFRATEPDSSAALSAYGQRAIFLLRLGRFGDAETLIRDVLARHAQKAVLPFSEYQSQLNNLAYLLNRTGRSAESAEIMGQLVEARTVALGPTAESTILGRYNLAYVLTDLGRFDEAESLLRPDLAFAETREKPGTFTPADYLGRLGEINLKRGRFATAIPDLQRAVAIFESPEVAATRHLEDAALARVIGSLALAQHAGEEPAAAHATLTHWLDQTEERFRARLNFTSEKDRLAFLNRERPLDLPATIGDPTLLARAVLRFKGVVLDSILEDQRLALASADPAVAQLLTDYQAALADDAANIADPLLGSRREQLERELARRTLTAAGHRGALLTDPAAVLAALPPGAALVEYVRYRDLTPPGADATAESDLALIGTAAHGWQIVRLGPAAELDPILARYRILVRRGGPIDWARTVRQRTLDPVRAVLPADIDQLIIAPDGPLNQVAFASLPEDDNHFVLQTLACSFVTSGRDLLAPANPSGAPTAGPPSNRILAAPAVTVREDLPALPGAAAEGQAIADLLPGADLLLGAAATPAALAASPLPQHLHLACHAIVPSAPDLDASQRLRQTGLVLAGPDGFLSAADIAALDLRTTQLVFLSACDSGGGETINGEGVFGLRRGFARAGAQTLVMTLWPVDDEAGRAIIESFYQTVAARTPPRAALVAAQRHAITVAQAEGKDPAAILRQVGAYTISWRR